jgi:hypothetical protein
MEPSPIANRLGLAGVVFLTAAFALSMMPVLIAPLTAEADVAAVRDDSGDNAVVAQEDDDDDDDDDDDTDTGTGDSGSRSIGSHSGNTRSGTTRGTGKSRSVSNSSGKSRNTKTGTTRGTGKSRSVSNSS